MSYHLLASQFKANKLSNILVIDVVYYRFYTSAKTEYKPMSYHRRESGESGESGESRQDMNSQYNSRSTTHTVQLTQYNSHSTTHAVQLTQYNSHSTTPTVQLTQYNSHSTTHTVQLTQYNSHSTTQAVQLTPCVRCTFSVSQLLVSDRLPEYNLTSIRAEGETSGVIR